MKKALFFGVFLLPSIVQANTPNCFDMKTIPNHELTLTEVINLGLCRNPQTSSAYLSSEIARYNKNAGYADYLPSVSASADMGKSYRNESFENWDYGASISASYLIFDFGKRLSDLNQLTATWQATGFDYDETVQNYVYGIIGDYYALLTANANIESATSLQVVAKTALDTANKKYKAGTVAKADVLNAETTLASRELSLERAKNNLQIAQGELLTRLSFEASQHIKIADMPSSFGKIEENQSIEQLLQKAEKNRPDLLKASANKDAAWHRRNSTFLKNLPSISASGSLSWGHTEGQVLLPNQDDISGSIGIRASMPIFAGFSNYYGVRAANASYEQAIESEKRTSDYAKLDVFTAFQNYKTAQNVLKQTQVLLKSATENENVTAGMYTVGKTTMLAWQQAQADLADAELQNNTAKYDLFIKRAALALAIGNIQSELGDMNNEEN